MATAHAEGEYDTIPQDPLPSIGFCGWCGEKGKPSNNYTVDGVAVAACAECYPDHVRNILGGRLRGVRTMDEVREMEDNPDGPLQALYGT